MRRRTARWLASVVGLPALAACGGVAGPGEGSLVFGGVDSACPPTVLTNDPLPDGPPAVGRDCFLAEMNAGRTVVWDLLVPTVEGDPLLWRHDFDGETVTITEDQTRDEFGSAGVTVRRCRDVRPGTAPFLDGVDCRSARGEGFASESLP